MLRMQERRAPWTHWFRNNGNQPGGVTLLQDFQAAHGTLEDYAGIPANLLDTPRSDPLVLEALVDNNSVSPQPNEFNTTKIEQQVKASNPAEPALNMPMGASSTWQQIYDFAAGGNAIPVPYHDVKVTDPSKLSSLTASYRAFVGGTLDARALPDLRDALLDGALADMGLRPRPGADGTGILQQMCQRCHNGTLDQTISRARFNVESMASMSRAEKDLAIDRLTQPASSPKLMPPARFGGLSDAERQTVVGFLTTVNIATRPTSQPIATARIARGKGTCARCTSIAIAVGTAAAKSAPTWYTMPTARARTAGGNSSVRKSGVTPVKPTASPPPRKAPTPRSAGTAPT